MKRMKIYLVAALYCLVVSCTTSQKIEQDDDFATETTDATLSADPSQSTADVSEFDLDEKATDPVATTETATAAPVEKDEFADFDNSVNDAPTDVAQTAPVEKDEFAEFDTPSESTPVPSEQAAQVPPAEAQPPVVAESSPAPVENTPAETLPEDGFVASNPTLPEQPPMVPDTPVPPVIVETPAPEAQPEPLTKIEQVFYKPNQNGGAITIEGDRPIQFTTRHNSTTNQLVVEIQNSVVPSKLKRSLNTKDMASSIGSVDIYQKANSKVARFVVQLRPGAEEPLIQPEGNSLLIIGAANEAFVAKQKADAEQAAAARNSPPLQAQNGFVDLNSDGIMNTQSLEEFLVGNQKFYGKKISIETNNVDITEAIKFIAEESGVNLLMDEGLEGKISLKLRQVPWDQALILILKAKKLGYVRQGSVLRIAKLTDLQAEESEAYRLLAARRSNEPMIVKRFFISYGNLADIQMKIRDFMISTAPVSSAQPIGSTQVGTPGAASGAPGAVSPTGAATVAPGASSLAATAAALATGGAGTAAPSTANAPGGATAPGADAMAMQNRMVLGRVISDERTGSLIVTDTKENMTKIEKLIAALDTQPKQIVVETRIVNATETFSKSMGFNWAAAGTSNPAQNAGILDLKTQAARPPSALTQATFSWKNLDIIGNLDAIIALGEIQEKVKVLNTQRITVSSGKAAQIGAESVLRIPTPQTTAVGNSAVVTNSELKEIKYGLKGVITPQSSNENTIFADVDLQQIALTDSTNGSTTNNQLGGRVLAQSGQTVAVNASFQSRNSSNESGVPGLRDVPILGFLFKGKSEEMSKAETLVFVTMTILEPVTGIFKKAAGEINSEAPQATE